MAPATDARLPDAIELALASLAATLGPQQQRYLANLRGALHTLVALRGSTVWTVEWLRPL